MPVKWAYGVTSVASRRDDLLPQTLASLAAAGFDRPRLFVDDAPDPEWYMSKFGLDVTTRWPKIRPFANWALSLAELYARDPAAERLAIFQDDIVVSRGLKEYLERGRLPDKVYQNLITYPDNQRLAPKDGGSGWFPSNQRGKGAQALVFSRDAVIVLLTHNQMVTKPLDQHRGWRNIDGVVSHTMRKEGYREFCHNPSLVRHVGRLSSFGNKRQPLDLSFRGEDFDLLTLLKK